MAVLFGVFGIYGVLAATVTSRTHELGIRIALGARTSNLVRGVVARGLALASAGLGLGLGLAWAGGGLIRNGLFGIQPTDTATLVQTGLLVLAAVVAASAIPALRATSVDPVTALREE